MVCEALIIEDEPGVAQVVRACLQRAGYAVRTARSGEDGLREIDVRKPDLVLLDNQLPGISGIDLLERLQAEAPEVKVVMLTGGASVPLVVEAMNRGACDFLTKPVDFDKLLRVAGEVIGRPAAAPTDDSRGGRAESGLGARLMQALPGRLRRLLQEDGRPREDLARHH